MSTLKVGLIGCGKVAQSIHLKILTRLPCVELIAIAEPDSGRRESASRQAQKTTAFDNYQDLLERQDVDAVIICLPNVLHAEATVAALQKGKHVYLEKPFATNLSDGRRMLAAWKQANTVGMMGYNYRWNRLLQATREYVQSGKLGEIISVRSVFSTAAKTLPSWKQTRASGGGVLFDLASHHIDLVHFFFGQEVREVCAGLRSLKSEGDSATLQLRLDNGLLVQSFFSLSSVEEDRFEIYGSSGKLTVDRYQSLDVEITSPIYGAARLKRLWQGMHSLSHSPYILEKLRSPNHEPSYQIALTRFVAAIQTNQSAAPDFWDGYRSLTVIAAVEESAETGRVVSLSNLAGMSFVR